MLSIEDQQSIYNKLPSTVTVSGATFNITKVTQAYDLPEYVNPTIAIQFYDEFRLHYQSIEQGFEELGEDGFTLTKDYSTQMLVTVAADDTLPTSRTITFTYAGSLVPPEPYLSITSITPSNPTIGQSVTMVYTRIVRGYDIARTIMRAIYDLTEYEFPVCVESFTQARDISRNIGRETLTVLQSGFVLVAPYTSTHSTPDEYIPIEEIDITCNL